ncbi:NACHT, LRR and PYD domains-containing protein 3-like [Diadema antillarum]|uniref:NACHT, LRR and PYD domains-containing protein 3-like n=1 Tax=Diadema antillarum TaxID=105358 RepID=UPI003A84761A
MIYKRIWSDLRTSPLHRESSVELDEIFTHLAMFFEGMGGTKTSMSYDNFTKHLKNICDKKETKTRIAIFGEAGVGKTTFLAKLTRDWALGRCLKDIDLLFLIPLREIEGNACFGDIIMNMIPDGEEFDGSRVEEYIRKKQNRVLILFDGLDEYGQDISKKTSNDDSISVIRGDKLTSCPVVVTTRTWRAEQVKSITEMEKNYKFVEITGFDGQDVISYISKFFPDNWVARYSLIKLITDEDSLVAQYMQPYPIYCSMLCYIWHDEGSRTIIQRLETFAQLFQELIHHLIVHYAGKEQNHWTKAKRLKKGEDALQQFAKDALSCLLKNKLVFQEEDLETSVQDLKTVCEIGVLTKEERFVCCRENNRRRTKNVVGYRIPHKLFQEYLAGLHLASLYESNREEFNHLVRGLLEDYRLFTHLFYFTVAQNKEVGRAVLVSLCKIDDVYRISPNCDPCEYHGHQKIFDFIIDVAFECQETYALEPVFLALNKMSSLTMVGSGHTTRGWNFVYKAGGNFAAKRLDDPEVTNVRCGAEAPFRRIDVLSNLRMLELENVRLDDDFFRAMAILAPQSKDEM